MPQVVLSPRATALRAALHTYLKPRLAMDAKLDLNPVLAALRKSKTLPQQKGAIEAAVRSITNGKLAQDADIADIGNLLDAIVGVVDSPTAEVPEEMVSPEDNDLEMRDVDHDGDLDMVRDEEGDPMIAKVREFLKQLGLSDEVMAQFDQLVASEDEPEEVIDKPDEEDMTRDSARRMARDTDTGGAAVLPKPKAPAKPPAMDAAAVERIVQQRVTEAVSRERENASAIELARRDVRPVVGDIALACDSAEAVYRTALGMRGVSTKDVHPSAYKPMFDIVRQQRAQAGEQRRVAQDAAPAGTPSFAERFPGTRNVRTH